MSTSLSLCLSNYLCLCPYVSISVSCLCPESNTPYLPAARSSSQLLRSKGSEEMPRCPPAYPGWRGRQRTGHSHPLKEISLPKHTECPWLSGLVGQWGQTLWLQFCEGAPATASNPSSLDHPTQPQSHLWGHTGQMRTEAQRASRWRCWPDSLGPRRVLLQGQGPCGFLPAT